MDVRRRSKIGSRSSAARAATSSPITELSRTLSGGDRANRLGGNPLEYDGRSGARVPVELDSDRGDREREVARAPGDLEERPVAIPDRELDACEDLVVRRAVVNAPVKKSEASIRRSPEALRNQRRVERDRNGGQFRGRVCVDEAAADRAPVTDRPVRDLANGLGEQRGLVRNDAESSSVASVVDPPIRYAVGLDEGQLGDPADVDEEARLCEA